MVMCMLGIQNQGLNGGEPVLICATAGILSNKFIQLAFVSSSGDMASWIICFSRHLVMRIVDIKNQRLGTAAEFTLPLRLTYTGGKTLF